VTRLTSRVRSNLLQASPDDVLIDMQLPQQFRLEQRDVARVEVDDDRLDDVLTLVRHSCLACPT